MRTLARFTLMLAAATVVAGTAAAQTVGFATLPPGAINNVQSQVIAKAVQQNTDLQIRVTPYRGGGAMTAAVNTKRAEFGITDAAELTSAFTGTNEYSGRAMPNLRVAFRVLAFPVGFWVRKDSDIMTIADIKGRKFSSEWTAFPNAIPLANALLATADLSLKDIDGVPATNIIRAANDFKSGKTEVLFFAVGAPKVAEVNSAVGGIRILSIEKSPVSLAKVKNVRPDYFIMTVPPLPHFAGVLKPSNVLGSDLTIFVGTHVSNEVAYKFVKAVHGQRAALIKGHPSFNGFQPKQMGKQFAVVSYHPGAIKYFKEIGIWPGK